MIETVKAFLSGNWQILVAVIVLLPSVFALGECDGRSVGRGQMQHAIDTANTKALQQQQRADTLASAQRITDALAVNHSTEVLRNAIASTPDTAPDAVRVQLGCARLRASGQDTTHIAACGRPGGGAQAGAAR